MSITKKSVNGKTTFEVFIKVRDKTGKQISRRRSFDTERAAKQGEFDLKSELVGHKTKILWRDWIDTVLERYRVEFVLSTYMNYRAILNKWSAPVWENRFVSDIKTSDVHDFIFVHCNTTSSYSKRAILKVVRRVFNLAVEDGIISHNPTAGINVRVADAKQGVLNRNEVEILLREARNCDHRFFPHWSLALLTGMRSGELYSLRWSDVDFVSGKIGISKSWSSKNGEGPTKSAKARICPISAECRKFLTELRSSGLADQEFVLPRLWEWDKGQQAKVLRSFCADIGITPIKFHDLRATFVTLMLNGNAPISKVMAVVGHASLKTTQGYMRLTGKDLEGATNVLEISIPSLSDSANVIQLNRG